jgi:hypothetical protein
MQSPGLFTLDWQGGIRGIIAGSVSTEQLVTLFGYSTQELK